MTAIFRGVKYHLPSTLSQERRAELTRTLTSQGATPAGSVLDATHIITNSDVFDGWRDIGPEKVVSDYWVERSIAAGKIQQLCFYSASPSKIFSGVVACSADLFISDEEVLTAGILELGGQWRMGLTRDVTHLFAMSPHSEKYTTGMTYRDQTHIKVLLPKWFDDSVEIGVSNLSTVDYEWPDPAVLHQRPDSPAKPMLSKQQLRSSMSPKKKALYQTASWDPSDLSRNIPASKSKDVWNGRRILLSTSLDLIRSRRKFVEEGIRKAHGVTVEYTYNNGDGDSEEELDLINECDILVTRYRAGPAFFKAWRTKKTIGTLSWLLHVQVMGVFSSPLDQILHFPIPRGAVEGFDKHIISITNYTGESRDYLKKLITLMGGNFTPSLSNKNTVLIAAQKSGPKTDKAADWSITVVNHTWLEDCFLRWQSLTPALHRYISYPAGIDFANILGERGLGKDIEDIVAAEAETEGEDVEEDAPPHDSQASADESEVMGGLMPSMDIDLMNFDEEGEEVPADTDIFAEQDEPMMSFDEEDEPPRRTPAGPSTPKSVPVSPAKKSARKKRIQGLETSSESEVDPEVVKKVVRIERPASTARASAKRNVKPTSSVKAEPMSPPKATLNSPSKATPRSPVKPAVKKGRDTNSEAEASQDSDDSEPVSRPARRNLVRRVSGPAPTNVRRSPRKAPDSQQATTSKLAPLESDSDLDDLPVQLAPARRKETPVLGGTIKAVRAKPTSAKQPDANRTKLPARKQATPTPPSSPLSPSISPKLIRRVPTATVSVVLPNLNLSASAKKAPPARTPSVSAVSHLRASGATPASVPARARTAPRASSPASSVATVEPVDGGRAKRSAAAQATQRLHDVIMPDVVNFQNEMRSRGRKGRRVSGRTEAEDEEEDEERSAKRRKIDAGNGRASTSDVEDRPAKAKPRKSEVALRDGKPIKLMHTQANLSDEVLKALAQLGAKVTNRATECTHLIVPGLVRTEKFLCALAGAPYILTTAWALDSAEAGKLLPEDDYLLVDAAGERKHNVTLDDTLKRAKALRGTLFKDKVFYITEKVKPSRAMIQNIIQANGGQAITNQRPSLRILETHPNRHVISSAEDSALWQQIATVYPVYTSELILMGALRQWVNYKDAAFKVKGSI